MCTGRTVHDPVVTADEYLWNLLIREAVDTGLSSPVRAVQSTLMPTLQQWAGPWLASVQPSGSFAKGTANRSGTDIDLFISLKSDTPDSLKEIYAKLARKLTEVGYSPRQQNVSLNIKVGSYSVDLVPGRKQDDTGTDHSLFRRRADTWTKTNVDTHIATVRAGGRQGETRLAKLWRNHQGLEFPSFYLELAVLEALGIANPLATTKGSWNGNMIAVFLYLRDRFSAARFVDPANTNNIISDDLSSNEKAAIAAAADRAIKAPYWSSVIA